MLAYVIHIYSLEHSFDEMLRLVLLSTQLQMKKNTWIHPLEILRMFSRYPWWNAFPRPLMYDRWLAVGPSLSVPIRRYKTTVYIGLGSNMGDRHKSILEAYRGLREVSLGLRGTSIIGLSQLK